MHSSFGKSFRREGSSRLEKFKNRKFLAAKLFLSFSFHLILRKEISEREAEAQRALSATQRIALHRGAFAMHQRRTLYHAGPRPFRSPVDRFSAGSTTPALALSRTPRCCAARRRNGKAHFRRRPPRHTPDTPAIFID